MPLNPEELHTFVDTIDKLQAEMTGLRLALTTADRRARWARSVAIVGVVVGIIGAAVGTLGVAVGASAQDTADTNVRIRKESQIGACIQANITTQRTREALVSGVSVAARPDARRTDAEQASLDRFVVEYTSNINAALPFRDCSAKGITVYYQSPPTDPAIGAGLTTTTTGKK